MSTMKIVRTAAIALVLSVCASSSAWAQNVPAPVHGVTFEEYAAASARLARNESLSSVLKVLAVDEAAYDEVGKAFIQALRDDKDLSLTKYYGQAFSNPDAGRFGKPAK